ncbi:MAG TPA: prolyl oligopeptidase family serine peptidase, partial [Niastella sp.]|nr:prolyl oligopeptidase family serine peptidase [Niastella sp.]
QIFASKGYGVLYINPRGSSGYGQTFSYGCVLNWGGGDYKDVIAGVEHVITHHDWIDKDRLFVTGQSYGGYLTNWIITQTDRFKAAIVDGGISNLISFAGTSLYHSLMESEFNGRAYDNFPLLWQWSPLRNVKQVKTPTLFLHGEVDNEVPVSQAEEMYIALKKLGVKTSFVRYLEEGHGWRPDLKPANRVDMYKRMIDWFNAFS